VPTFRTVYNVLLEHDLPPPAPTTKALVWVLSASVGLFAVALVAADCRFNASFGIGRHDVLFTGLFCLQLASGFAVMPIIGDTQFNSQQQRKEWARNGASQAVIEGPVELCKDQIVGRPGNAFGMRIRVLRVAGVDFRQHAGRWPNFQQGQHVRVTHHEHSVLKIEVSETSASGTSAQ
jgi:hypothetical protein